MHTLPPQARRRCLRPLVFAFASVLAGTSAAATITVNSTANVVANDGQCTLHEAMTAANNNIASGGMAGECAAGQAAPIIDTIAFVISGPGVHTIAPTNSLPQILEVVTIDGYTQTGAAANTLATGDNAVLAIAIDASNLLDPPFNLHGGVFGGGDASGTTIRGLSIHHLAHNSAVGSATGFGDGANNIVIQGNWIGTVPDGATVQDAIACESGLGWVIGGSTPAARNVITTAANDAIFFNNCSSGFIQGNLIGVSLDGTSSLGAPSTGIQMTQRANGNLIGGSAAGEGNVIAVASFAIRIDTSDGNTIKGNLLGTDATGTKSIENTTYGINTSLTTGTTIGGPGAGEGNVISGNIFGVQMDRDLGATIQGNKIGVAPDGTTAVPNLADGILITNGGASGGGMIGGTVAGAGNIIANSCSHGIALNNGANDWPILGNSIFSNSGLGISLNSGTPTTNDPSDGDTGNNNLQNYPVITSAAVIAGNATVSGTLNSESNKQYRLEFFSGVDCSKSGFGEGQHFLGSADVTTDVGGNASFGPLNFSAAPNNLTAFSATATDPDLNTSEFSMCVGGIGRIFANSFEVQCP